MSKGDWQAAQSFLVDSRLKVDLSGRVLGVVSPDGAHFLDLSDLVAGLPTGIAYDGSDRVQSFVLNGIAYTVTYTAASKVETIVGGGRTLTYTYDVSDRLTDVTAS